MIKLAVYGLRHYWRLSLCLFLGVFTASAILTGSLLVGDSVKQTLRDAAGLRVGGVKQALVAGERYITQDLGARLSDRMPGTSNAPVLFIPGIISTPDKEKRANGIRIYGVTESFWKIAGRVPPRGDYLAVGKPLADRLDLKSGDGVIARMEIPGRVSRDAPLSGETDDIASVNAPITHVIAPEHLGGFSLLSEQTDALNVFVPLGVLQAKLDKPGRINLLLSPSSTPIQPIIEEVWSLADAELVLRSLSDSHSALFSDRVFISEEVERAVSATFPDAEGILTYLVNELYTETSNVPYSVAVGIGPRSAKRLGVSLPAGDEIVVNDWLAAPGLKGGLEASVGHEIGITFFAVNSSRDFFVVGDGKTEGGALDDEDRITFRVSGVIPQGASALSDGWLPEFPGLETAKTLATWESGLPIETKRIREVDELFWDRYKATPKAFISLERAQQLWGNRFGRLSAIHLGRTVPDGAEFVEALRKKLQLKDLGIRVRHLSAEKSRAVEGALDFGMLFASLSGFLVLSSILLVALLCVFGMESRAGQIGLMAALGFTGRKIHRLFLFEAVLVCISGASLGALGGIGYTKIALLALGGVWSGAASGVSFVFYATPSSIIAGVVVIFTVAMGSIYFAGRHLVGKSPQGLLSGGACREGEQNRARRTKRTLSAVVAGICSAMILVWMGTGLEGEKLAGAFFGAGFLLLVAGIGLFMLLIDSRKGVSPIGRSSLYRIACSNLIRNRGRSLAVVAMVSGGVFLVSAVNAFRLSEDSAVTSRETGTGGFRFIGTTSLPVYDDLNAAKVRDRYGLEDFSTDQLSFVQMRVSRDGEEASCLNLNHASRPRIVGVDPDELARRGAFRFAASTVNLEKGDSAWSLLELPEGEAVIPVVGDKASVMWALKKNLGESIFYPDGKGGEVELRIVALLENSILQGNLMISENAFKRVFPDAGGQQFFLVDVGENTDAEQVSAKVIKSLEMQGMALESSKSRLAAYARVQNTYISIFTVLGGLGTLLGTAGVGIVIARNVIERRGELAIMNAIGFRRKSLINMLLAEHFTLVMSGIALGFFSALITISPSLFGNSGGIPLGNILFMTTLIAVGGLFFCLFAASLALRGSFLEAISNE